MNRKMKSTVIALFFLFGVATASNAGLVVNDLEHGVTPTDLANALVGNGVTISNVTYTGSPRAAGRFTGGSGIIGFDSGLVLDSGKVQTVTGDVTCSGGVEGPNGCHELGGPSGSANLTDFGLPGDAQLTALSGNPTFDAAILEFDFVPQFATVQFRYVFSSEEYSDYANSAFNDVFAFYINGVNCAVVPGTNEPVSINTINNGNDDDGDPTPHHPEFFIDNVRPTVTIDTQMDGLTVVLTCSATVTPGQPNHMKLAIADASDGSLDTAIFIQAESLISGTVITTSLSGGGQVGPVITVPNGTVVTDSATLGGVNSNTATGTVSYAVYSDSECSTLFANAGTKTVTNGQVPDSDPVTFSLAGTYYWKASYSGDALHNPSSSPCGDERVTVLPPAVPYSFSTLAGLAGTTGSADGTGNTARFNNPEGVAVDNSGTVYVADLYNHTIRKITPAGVVTTFVGSAGNFGSTDATGNAARFYQPRGVAVDATRNVYVADTLNHTIRKVSPAGVVTTLAGLAGNPGSLDGTGNAARFQYPSGVAVDAAGNFYVADFGNDTIRKGTPAGVVTTLAGSAGQHGSADGSGIDARFFEPFGIAIDGSSNVYVADTYNHTIRRITSTGVVSTLAGLAGSPGGEDGIGSGARFFYPRGVAADAAGNVYVGDTSNSILRKIAPDATVTTVAGMLGSPGSADGVGPAARFNQPSGVAVDAAASHIYIADIYNNTIRVGSLPALQLIHAVSRKTHGSAGAFDIELPLTGQSGVECRSGGGNHTLVFTFSNDVVSGNAIMSAGTASLLASPALSGKTMTVGLTNVADVQEVTVLLTGVTDAMGQVLPDTAVSVNMMIGDTNGNRSVTASDVAQTKAQSGAPVTSENFRTDINVNGNVSASDVAQVKANAGHTLP